MHEEDRERVAEIVERGIVLNEPYIVEYRIVRADGDVRWLYEQGQAVLDDEGRPRWLDGVILDISERKAVEEEMAHATALLDSIVENIPTMLFLKEAKDLRIVRVNKAFEDVLGLDREEILGKNDADIVHPEIAEGYMRKDQEVLAGGKLVVVGAEPIQTATGEDRTLYTSKVPILDEHGKPLYMLGISEDVTDRQRAEEERERLLRAEQAAHAEAEAARAQLAEQNEQLRQLDRLKDEFVALVSHELRTPLTSILGYVDLMLEEDELPLSDEHQNFLGVVRRNSERLLNLVGDLLFVAQVDAGKLALDTAPVDLIDLARDCVEAIRPRADAKQIELSLEEETPSIVDGDRLRLAQLLDNLVSNAIKFTPDEGRVTVRVAGEGDSVALTVADTGIGISAEDQRRLFERFFRTEGATRLAIQGTGLGLTIAKAIVEAHHGAISVESKEGVGTTFRAEFPRLARPAADLAA
jgi:PAS domain S-box-containing protein